VLAIGTHPGNIPVHVEERPRHDRKETCVQVMRASGIDFACVTFADLVVAAAQREGATLLIRGLRSATDFDYEMEMAGMNGAYGAGLANGVPAGGADQPPDHRHTGAADRIHGWRRIAIRAVVGGRPPESKIRRQVRPLIPGDFMIRLLAALAVLICAAPALAQQLPAGADPQNTLLIDTKYGRIVIKLRNDLAPKHVERIKQLAREKYYDNVPFHRVIAGFMAQTGDGARGDGTGGSKYPNLPAEFSNVPFKRGIVGMARANDPNSANSQFFIMYADGAFLNGKYTVVGEVLSGMDASTRSRKASRWPIPIA
jgi:peptidylprolyl isomerase